MDRDSFATHLSHAFQANCFHFARISRLTLGPPSGQGMATSGVAAAAGALPVAPTVAAAAAAPVDELVAAVAAVAAAGDPAANRLAELEQDQRELQARKKANQKLIKNEQKKRQRPVEKAKKLSTEELQQVLVARAAAEAKAKGKAKAKAKAKAAAVQRDASVHHDSEHEA